MANKVTAAQLAGVMPPVPTPFDAAGEVAPDRLQDNIQILNSSALTGYVILGSNGEYVYLDEDEKIRLIKASREAASPEKLIVAGTGTESTRATVRLTQAAAEVGADVAIIITPAYYKNSMTADALIAHFTTVADNSPIPVVLYNMPAYTGLDMATDTIVRLAGHPNIIGLKESSGNLIKIGEVVSNVAARGYDFKVLAGSASFLLPTLAMGGVGGVVATANIAPELCLNIYRAFAKGDLATAQKEQHNVMALNTAVTSRFGVAGLKFAMDQLGMFGGPLRPPLLPLGEAAGKELLQIIQSAGLSLK